jgi:leucyl-tRNA synthetase
VTVLLSPVAPHVAEELWTELGEDGMAAEAEWPDATRPANYDTEKRLVENTREDIRDIVEVAGIEDPARIEIAVAPDWKHRVREIAREADGDVVPTVMQDSELREHGNDAADYAKELAGTEYFDDVLAPENERETLERASWLIEREFDAEVVVHDTESAPDGLVSKAVPGRPGIDIDE